MNTAIEQDYAFFREAILNVSSSLDLSQAMLTAFDFLKQHFPLDGLSLHTLNPDLAALHLLFLVTNRQFHHLDDLVPLNEPDVHYLLHLEKHLRSVRVSHSIDRPVSVRHSAAISAYLPNRDRAYLVAILSAQEKAVGHLCLIGRTPACFTPEHERKLSILVPAFSLVMMNLLQYREKEKLQERLMEEKQYLVGKVRQLSKEDIIGAAGGLKQVMEMVGQLTGRDVPVLITGETGSGKELVANAVQRVSDRYDAPYIKVNCGAIPDSLIDSELFGHEKGAFTGAVSRRTGRFEQAHTGTLFLDEIGDMPPKAQTRLLRVLQNKTLDRVGGTRSIHVDVRIIAATHHHLEEKVTSGAFRQDLYYRLNVFPIVIPPLRQRIPDIPALVHYFIRKKAARLKLRSVPRLSAHTLENLTGYSWPGNVRELENLVERALIINPDGPLNLHQHLPENLNPLPPGPACPPHPATDSPPAAPYDTRPPLPSLDDTMRRHIEQALDQCNGTINGPAGAACLLKINPSTLRRRMEKLNIPYGRRRFHGMA